MSGSGDGMIDWPRFRAVAADCGWSDGELMRFYADGTREQLEQIRRALGAGDAAELRRLAHGARGASETCGMRGLAALFGDLEELARGGRLEDGGALIERCRRRLEDGERALGGADGAP